MKKVIIHFSVLLFMLFVRFPSVYAGWHEGGAAYQRGDYETAFKEFKPLAEQGNIWAQYYVGQMYIMGQGIPKDYAEAFKWYKKAAQHGYSLAQGVLGWMYLEGDGVPRDHIISYMWLNLAAAQGNEGAITYRSILEEEMTPEQITQAQRLSREFKVKSP